jgi:hypothetical protein
LNRRFTEGSSGSHFFLSRSPQKFVAGEPTVKDVCVKCNNGELSRLDTYACELYDLFFHKIIEQGESVHFIYDYDQLLKWLMKIAYNSARIHGSDTGILAYYAKYILGNFRRPRNVRLFAQLICPGIVTPMEEAAIGGEAKAGSKIYPDRLRVGHVAIADQGMETLFGRSVIINAFAFSLFVGDRNSPETGMHELEKTFILACPSSKLLKPDAQEVEVSATGLNAKEALSGHYAAHADAYKEPWRKFQEKHQKK